MADEARLPTIEEIAQLPRWARVAFSARCARRALPLFVKYWPDAPKQHVDAVNRAVELAEQSASLAAYATSVRATYAAAVHAAREAYGAPDFAATHAADTAARAVATRAAQADHCADVVATSVAAGVAISLVWMDFNKVLELAAGDRWTDETPVPPELFGPITEQPTPALQPPAGRSDEAKLPTGDAIRGLPRWARVAFEARCARRVLPLFRYFWPDVLDKHALAVEKAVELAERSAALASCDDPSAADVITAAGIAVDATADAAIADFAASPSAEVALAACHAASAAYENTTAIAAFDAAGALESYDEDSRTVRAISHDFHFIRSLANARSWTDVASVPPEVFGPLWPYGLPEGWPTELSSPTTPTPPITEEEQDADFEIVLRAIAEPGVTAETVSAHLVKLYRALNEYCLAKYGHYLTRDRFKRLVYEYTGVTV
jgi:hypothetical protein